MIERRDNSRRDAPASGLRPTNALERLPKHLTPDDLNRCHPSWVRDMYLEVLQLASDEYGALSTSSSRRDGMFSALP